MKPLLVGEAPNRSTSGMGYPPLSGAPSVMVCQALGIALPDHHLDRRGRILKAYQEMRRLFDARNLLSRHPGLRWPADEAREAARKIELYEYRAVVLLGRKVARAFGLRGDFFGQTTLEESCRRTVVLFAPHTSRLSHLWNDAANVQRLGDLLRRAIALGGG